MTQKAAYLEITIILVLFVFFSYLVQTNTGQIQDIISNDGSGALLYVLVTIVAIVIAPISTMPLLPLASNVFGPLKAALLSVAGWTIGSFFAFVIARKYGIFLVKKFVSLEKIEKLEKMVPKENAFWGIVFLRMVIPVDILSYALGLFSRMNTGFYVLATLIGVTPFALLFAYAGRIHFSYQLSALVIAVIIIGVGVVIKQKFQQR